MLQDLFLPPQAVVPGDHVVFQGRFYKVLESHFFCWEDEKGVTQFQWNTWELVFCDPSREGGNFCSHYELDPSSNLDGKAPLVRVRPCGPSSFVEEQET